jgi:ABC-type methionine transport system ATPase subunit
VIVTHEMEVVRSICHTVAVMEQGSVVDRFALNDRDKKNVIPPRLTFREQLLGKDSDSND